MRGGQHEAVAVEKCYNRELESDEVRGRARIAKGRGRTRTDECEVAMRERRRKEEREKRGEARRMDGYRGGGGYEWVGDGRCQGRERARACEKDKREKVEREREVWVRARGTVGTAVS